MSKTDQSEKKLALKKTAVAHLSLSNAQMQTFVGGNVTTLHTSRDVNGDPNTCTGTDDTKIFITWP